MLGVAALAQLALAQLPGTLPAHAPSGGHQGGGNLEHLRHGFLRRRRKLEEAIAAARKAELEADKRGEIELEIAAHEAARVLSEFHEQAELSTKELDAFTRTLRLAQGAKTAATALKSATAIDRYVVSYKAHLREQEDEEDAVTLLLLS